MYMKDLDYKMDEIHLTKKDFKIEWFSGQGAGGQHRNKHQNCCRIVHLESGLKLTYKEVVLDGDLSKMIEARRIASN